MNCHFLTNQHRSYRNQRGAQPQVQPLLSVFRARHSKDLPNMLPTPARCNAKKDVHTCHTHPHSLCAMNKQCIPDIGKRRITPCIKSVASACISLGGEKPCCPLGSGFAFQMQMCWCQCHQKEPWLGIQLTSASFEKCFQPLPQQHKYKYNNRHIPNQAIRREILNFFFPLRLLLVEDCQFH